jgi:hypothetical protein
MKSLLLLILWADIWHLGPGVGRLMALDPARTLLISKAKGLTFHIQERRT